jgi:hypothetical protein
MTATFISYESLKLLDSSLFALYHRLGLQSYSIVGVKLFLKLDYGLISLIQSRCQRNHDVSLLKQKLLIPIDLRFSFFYLCPFSFNLV